MRIILLVFLCFIIFACESTNVKNIDSESQLWGECKYEDEYTLLMDVFLIQVDKDIGHKRIALSPEGNYKQIAGQYTTPPSVKEYKINPIELFIVDYDNQKFVVPILGVVKSGTPIKCIKLEKYEGYSFWYGYYEYLIRYAEILSGKFKGKIVDIVDLTYPCCKENGYKIDLNLLQPVRRNRRLDER